MKYSPGELPDKRPVPQRAVVWSALWMTIDHEYDAPNVTRSAILTEESVTVIDFYRGRPAPKNATQPRALG